MNTTKKKKKKFQFLQPPYSSQIRHKMAFAIEKTVAISDTVPGFFPYLRQIFYR